jgi:uncharacterized protein
MDDLLTIKEAAALMKVTDRTIRRWIADGRLDASKIARTVRIRRTALEALVQPGPGKTQHPAHSGIKVIGTPLPRASNAPVPMPEISHIPSQNETGSPLISELRDEGLQAPAPQTSPASPVADQPPLRTPPPDLQTILSTLRQKLPFIRTQYDVHLLGVFGSYRRGEQTPTSDLDLLVAFRETPGLLKYIELEHYLSDLIGVKVDLAMGDALKARVGENAQPEVALV